MESDASHCGECNRSCGEGERCESAVCVTTCEGEEQLCDGSCVDLYESAAHCGACGSACGEGEMCQAGSCVEACPEGELRCGETCVDADSSNLHCGACDTPCAEGLTCVEGNCGCAGGLEFCDGACIDTDTHPLHCGTCDQACAEGWICKEGSCGCPEGTEPCGEKCVDTFTDMEHCGACDASCSAGDNTDGAVCELATCRQLCDDGYLDCNEDAADGCEVHADFDTENCGACGLSCAELPNIATASGCAGGSCQFTCLDGFGDCDPAPGTGCETDLRTSVEHCGACQNDCRELPEVEDATCADRACEITACAEGYGNCDGDVENGCETETRSDPEHCGTCGNACPILCGKGECVGSSRIFAGPIHACTLLESEEIRCWGGNSLGNLGNGNLDPSSVPIHPDAELPPIANVVLGEGGTCVVGTDHSLWCWGRNTHGQIDPTLLDKHRPVETGVSGEAKDAAIGAFHICMLTLNGEVFCQGRNDVGQLGDPDLDESAHPVKVEGLPPIASIHSGYDFNCALSLDGEVWCWGRNSSAQLTGDSAEPPYRATPMQVENLGTVKELTLGSAFACALNTDDELHCWGSNQAGQLGAAGQPGSRQQPQGIGTPVRVQAGGSHACAINTDHEMWCWGYNSLGQLGDGTSERHGAPVRVIDLVEPTDLALGGDFSCAANAEGRVWCWGENGKGQLGDGTTETKFSPTEVVWGR